jgi:hypothetical protein
VLTPDGSLGVSEEQSPSAQDLPEGDDMSVAGPVPTRIPGASGVTPWTSSSTSYRSGRSGD